MMRERNSEPTVSSAAGVAAAARSWTTAADETAARESAKRESSQTLDHKHRPPADARDQPRGHRGGSQMQPSHTSIPKKIPVAKPAPPFLKVVPDPTQPQSSVTIRSPPCPSSNRSINTIQKVPAKPVAALTRHHRNRPQASGHAGSVPVHQRSRRRSAAVRRSRRKRRWKACRVRYHSARKAR